MDAFAPDPASVHTAVARRSNVFFTVLPGNRSGHGPVDENVGESDSGVRSENSRIPN